MKIVDSTTREPLNMKFSHLTKEEAIEKYLAHISKLQRFALQNQIDAPLFKLYMLKQFQPKNKYLAFYRTISRTFNNIIYRRRKTTINLLTFFFALLIFVKHKDTLQAMFLRQSQNYIYPSMTTVRRMTVPILNSYPHLTRYYDESCLIFNPYFKIDDNTIDCGYCKDRRDIPDLSHEPMTDLFEKANLMPFYINVSCETVEPVLIQF